MIQEGSNFYINNYSDWDSYKSRRLFWDNKKSSKI